MTQWNLKNGFEEWRVFTVIEIPDDKMVNTGTFHLTGETDIWRNTLKNRLLGTDFTSSRFVEELTIAHLSTKWKLTNAVVW